MVMTATRSKRPSLHNTSEQPNNQPTFYPKETVPLLISIKACTTVLFLIYHICHFYVGMIMLNAVIMSGISSTKDYKHTHTHTHTTTHTHIHTLTHIHQTLTSDTYVPAQAVLVVLAAEGRIGIGVGGPGRPRTAPHTHIHTFTHTRAYTHLHTFTHLGETSKCSPSNHKLFTKAHTTI